MRGLDDRVEQVRANRVNPGDPLELLDLRVRLSKFYQLPASLLFFFGSLVKKPVETLHLRPDSSVPSFSR